MIKASAPDNSPRVSLFKLDKHDKRLGAPLQGPPGLFWFFSRHLPANLLSDRQTTVLGSYLISLHMQAFL
jgi:hypothetical protein